ncbi:MAG: hypothetical protein NT062_07965, partial [Proteobacteria bacterium]|nr:hypothetical protein [Pseudomonadota bacterium]
MKIWKILVLVAGLAGVAGFFLPIVNYAGSEGVAAKSCSGFEVVKGGCSGADVVDKAKAVGKDYELTKGATEKLDAQVETGIAALKGIIAGLYVPAFLIFVFGVVGLIRGRFQRVSGIFTAILGLISAAIWGIFALGAGDANSGFSVGLGLHMLLVAGLG